MPGDNVVLEKIFSAIDGLRGEIHALSERMAKFIAENDGKHNEHSRRLDAHGREIDKLSLLLHGNGTEPGMKAVQLVLRNSDEKRKHREHALWVTLFTAIMLVTLYLAFGMGAGHPS